MPQKTKKPATPKPPKTHDNGDTAAAIYGFAKELSAALEDVRGLRGLDDQVESLAQSTQNIAFAIDKLANATALSVIANKGFSEDSEQAVRILKRWFEEFNE